jgi:glycosyltransferase involved in cell wall biosynthesis
MPYHAGIEEALAAAGATTISLYADVSYLTTGRSVRGRPSPTRTVPRSLAYLVRLARARPACVVCSEYGPEMFLCALVAKLLRCHVLVFQEHAGRSGEQLTPLDRRYRRLLARLADGFVANSDAAAEEIAALGVERRRIHRITLLAPPRREALCKGRLPLPQATPRPIFLYAGRLIPTKNVTALLEALGQLRDSSRTASVWIAGSGDDEQRLRRRCRELGVEDAITWLGSIPYESIGHVYDQVDVMVMPTFGDYRNLAVLEAMRFGKPVIDSRADGNAGDAVVEGETGFLFDPHDVGALADCMARFIDDNSLVVEMGARARATVAQQRLDVAAATLADLARQLTDDSSVRSRRPSQPVLPGQPDRSDSFAASRRRGR